jgi:hypothetical protein
MFSSFNIHLLEDSILLAYYLLAVVSGVSKARSVIIFRLKLLAVNVKEIH